MTKTRTAWFWMGRRASTHFLFKVARYKIIHSKNYNAHTDVHNPCRGEVAPAVATCLFSGFGFRVQCGLRNPLIE